jgi:hypothetical protein
MKTNVFLSSILILAASLFGFPGAARQVSAQEIVTAVASPGVPIAREPHYHLVFQNSFVNVYEIEVAPGYATLMHQHDYDNFFVVFGNADLTNAVAGENPTKLELPDLGIHFEHEPYANIIANTGKGPFRNITVELLRTQGQVTNVHSSIKDALSAAPPDHSGIRQTLVLGTDEVQVIAVAVPSSKAWAPPQDGRDRLVVMLDKINGGALSREADSPFPAGMLAWFPADTDLSVPNESDQQIKLMILEFNDTQQEVDQGSNSFSVEADDE